MLVSILTLLIILPSLFVHIATLDLVELHAYSNTSHQSISFSKDQKCKYPQLNPFDPSILPFISHPVPLQCQRFLYSPVYSQNATVHLNMTVLTSLHAQGLYVYFRYVSRSDKDDHSFNLFNWNTMEEPISLHSTNYSYVEIVVAANVSSIATDFRSQNAHFWTVYQLWPEVGAFQGSKKPNVIIFGIDSLSRTNVMRNLPLTYAFLNDQLKATVLQGYVKMADNTFPNMLATLTGRKAFSSELKGHYQKDQVDMWPFVWKNFSVNGYTTILAEEQPGIFTYKAKGFRDPPVDVYFRPMGMALTNVSVKQRQSKYCVGDKPEISHLLDNLCNVLRDFTSRQVPFFSFSFLWKISHDKVNEVEIADQILLDFLRDLQTSAVLEDSILIFMSDHGNRFDHIRQTLVGRIEERMPFASLHLPNWYMRQRSTAKRNLHHNSVRLTTNYDIHETLLDILGLKSGSTRAISLFAPIPENRTCEDAEIPPNFCVCQEETNLPVDELLVVQAAHFVVDYIHEVLLRNTSDLCTPLNLAEILNAQQLQSNSEVIGNRKWRYGTYVSEGTASGLISFLRVTLRTEPGGGVFETSMQFDSSGDRPNDFQIPGGEISRINAYGSAGNCVSAIDRRLEKFCFCLQQRQRY